MSEAEDSELDIEAEWAEARVDAGLPARPNGEVEPLWIFPMLLLYTGFFFGPFVTLLIGVLTLRGHVTVRKAAFLTGVAGTIWCLVQGLSIYFGPAWSQAALQALRSGLNFVFGIVCYAGVRRQASSMFAVTRKTFVVSALAMLVAAGLFLLIPPEILIAMGR